ncbi:MAG: hypothetical protein ACREJO_02315 [Phycisphaerales bacterium]
MKSLNLIPERRRLVQRLSRRKQSWMLVSGAYALVAIGGAYFALPRSGRDEETIMRDLTNLRGQAAQLDTQLKSSRDAAGAAQKQLTAANAVGEQPDWSILLAKLAEERGTEVVLESVELATVQVQDKPKPDAKLKAGAKPPTLRETIMLKLAGATRSPDEAYVFARRLEQTGLFAQARVLETRPRDLLGEQVSGFRIECAFNERPAAKPAPKPADKSKQTAAAGAKEGN